MIRHILLCGAAIVAATPSAVSAQRNYSAIKPQPIDMCVPKPQFRLENTTPSPWHSSINTEPYAVDPISAGYTPIATCGPAVRWEDLKCVQISNGQEASTSSCNNAATIDAYVASHGNRFVKTYKKGTTNTLAAIDVAGVNGAASLPACPSGRYVWKLDEPDTGSICGTQRVAVQSHCYDNSSQYGPQVDDGFCIASEKPAEKSILVESKNGCSYDYQAPAWALPEASCGEAVKSRIVACQSSSGATVDNGSCETYFGEYGSEGYGKIFTDDGRGHIIYRMPSLCNLSTTKQILEECDLRVIAAGDDENTDYASLTPKASMTFNDARTCGEQPGGGDPVYEWKVGTFTPDHARLCGSNTRTATVSCVRKGTDETVAEALCDSATKPATTESFEDVSGCVPQGVAQCRPGTVPADKVAAAQACMTASGSGGSLDHVVNLEGGATAYCVVGSSVTSQLCAPSDWNGGNYQSNDERDPSYIMRNGEGVCGGLVASCEAKNEPAPVAQITVGWCGYTSSGGGRYACGDRVTYRNNPPAPQFEDLCSGRRIAGALTMDTLDGNYQTPNAGKGWSKAPVLENVAGAQCVVHYRIGYSDANNAGWQSVYFDGPSRVDVGGLFIAKKP